jgi:hypothetical protein
MAALGATVWTWPVAEAPALALVLPLVSPLKPLVRLEVAPPTVVPLEVLPLAEVLPDALGATGAAVLVEETLVEESTEALGVGLAVAVAEVPVATPVPRPLAVAPVEAVPTPLTGSTWPATSPTLKELVAAYAPPVASATPRRLAAPVTIILVDVFIGLRLAFSLTRVSGRFHQSGDG